jgi:hypothetical protein
LSGTAPAKSYGVAARRLIRSDPTQAGGESPVSQLADESRKSYVLT